MESHERNVRTSPVKVVRVVPPEDHEDSCSNYDPTETNIVVNVTTNSPRKKRRRPSATTLMLDEELQAEASRRRSSLFNDEEDQVNLAQLVASLRRQNEDLKAKMSNNKAGDSSIDNLLVKEKDKECQELRTTVSRLERLLSLEREERNSNEKKTLELLGDIKKKWHDREEQRLAKLHKDLEMANTVVQDMELELHKRQSDLDKANEDIDTLQTVKVGLKAKLKECKGKLEATVANYEVKCERIQTMESHLSRLEERVAEQSKEQRDKKRRVSVVLSDNRQDLEAAVSQVERLTTQRQELESELAEARSEAKSVGAKVKVLAREKSSLQQEYDRHLSKCDAHLVKLRSENGQLRERNEELERDLAKKASNLGKLECVLGELENKIPTRESLKAVADKKATEQSKAFEELQKDFSMQKIELRIAERKVKEHKERIDFLREMLKEEKDKRIKVETGQSDQTEILSKLESDKETVQREKESLAERNETLKARLDRVTKELAAARAEGDKQTDLNEKVADLRQKLSRAEKEADELTGIKRKYEMTKQVCLELEDQIKEYESVIDKLEKTHERLKESNASLKSKSDENASELIKTKAEVNELKSLQAFNESKLKDLQEKNKEIEKFYENEGTTWRTKYEETVRVKKDQTTTIVELKDRMTMSDKERERFVEDNERLHDQNAKLKEEMTTLITSIHSLKESNLMLQTTVQELADKLTARDDELKSRAGKLKQLKEEMDKKSHEHKVTMEQLKKLTLHLPATPSKKKDKLHPPFLL